MDNIREILNLCVGKENVKINEPMSKHTSFKIGGSADFLVYINDLEKLKNVLEIASKYNLPIFILGNGSNLLVSDKGIRGITCKINISKFDIVKENQNVLVTLGAGNKIMETAYKLKELGIAGLEFASGIPRKYWWSN